MSQIQDALSSEIRPALAHYGYIVVDLLDHQSVKELRLSHDRVAPPVDTGFDSTILSTDPSYRHAVDRMIRAIVEPALVRLIPDHRVGFCTFAVKSPGLEGEVPMHQDWSFVDEQRAASVGLWIPLTDVDLSTGCLQVVPGSHAFPHAPRAACTPFAYPQLVAQLKSECLETVPMKAGQAMLFDNRLFHCSPANIGSAQRIAATAVIVPAGCTMRYYHLVDRDRPNDVEVFEVPDDFFLYHTPGTRPRNSTSLGFIDLSAWSIQT